MKKLKYVIVFVIVFLAVLLLFQVRFVSNESEITSETIEVASSSVQTIEPPKDEIKSVTITGVGDCTIGWDPRYEYYSRYDRYLDDNDGDYNYYFAKVQDVFSKDDLTIINLEGVFTNSKNLVPKEFNLSSPPEYKAVIENSSIEVVSFANNHTYDYGEEGYNDTIDALNSINMPFYSYSTYLIKEVNGIKIGFFALCDIDCENYEDIDKALSYLKTQSCDLIIASMHWGIEGDYKQCNAQVKMGHYLIDNGVDLVLGSHPHRIQGVEKYNDRFIVYSLSNFTFGANQNPNDKDTFIYQQTFTFKNGELVLDDNINLIPASQSGVSNKNNYQPIVLNKAEGKRVVNKVLRYSSGFEYEYEDTVIEE